MVKTSQEAINNILYNYITPPPPKNKAEKHE